MWICRQIRIENHDSRNFHGWPGEKKLRSFCGYQNNNVLTLFYVKWTTGSEPTPSKNAWNLEEPRRSSSSENHHQELVHVDRLHQHPRHGCQHEVVDKESKSDAPGCRMTSVDADDEREIEKEKGYEEVDVDLLRSSAV